MTESPIAVIRPSEAISFGCDGVGCKAGTPCVPSGVTVSDGASVCDCAGVWLPFGALVNCVADDSPVGSAAGTYAVAGVSVPVSVDVASTVSVADAGVIVGVLVAVVLRKGVLLARGANVAVLVAGGSVDVAGAMVFAGNNLVEVAVTLIVAVLVGRAGVSVSTGASGTSE